MKCEREAVAKIKLEGNESKYVCDKHLQYLKVFAKKFKVGLETEKIEEGNAKCESR